MAAVPGGVEPGCGGRLTGIGRSCRRWGGLVLGR